MPTEDAKNGNVCTCNHSRVIEEMQGKIEKLSNELANERRGRAEDADQLTGADRIKQLEKDLLLAQDQARTNYAAAEKLQRELNVADTELDQANARAADLSRQLSEAATQLNDARKQLAEARA